MYAEYLHANFGIDTSRQAEVLQAIDSLWRRVGDVDKALMNAHFEALTTRFVDVRALDDCERALASWQWDWPGNSCAGADSRVDDLLS